MDTISKAQLIEKLNEIRNRGWILGGRPGNAGSVGNTIEDLLGIVENNLPIPNAAEWELKARRENTSSLITLFHMEPSPRTLRHVPKQLLPLYGWPHKNREKYGPNEMSFRQTINAVRVSDRGFSVGVNHAEEKIFVSFDISKADTEKHVEWIEAVKKSTQNHTWVEPYWGFSDLFHKAGTKLTNCFLLSATTKIENGKEYFHYEKIYMLSKLSLEKFIKAIENGNVYIDFDARTGHNHGTKFRVQEKIIHMLYEDVQEL